MSSALVWVGIKFEDISFMQMGINEMLDLFPDIFTKAAENLQDINTENQYWWEDYVPLIKKIDGNYILEASTFHGLFGEIHVIFKDINYYTGLLGFGIEICDDLCKEENPIEVYSSPKIAEATEMLKMAIDKAFVGNIARQIKESIKIHTDIIEN